MSYSEGSGRRGIVQLSSGVRCLAVAMMDQGEIARVIRAVNEAEAAQVVINGEGKFALCYHQMCRRFDVAFGRG